MATPTAKVGIVLNVNGVDVPLSQDSLNNGASFKLAQPVDVGSIGDGVAGLQALVQTVGVASFGLPANLPSPLDTLAAKLSMMHVRVEAFSVAVSNPPAGSTTPQGVTTFNLGLSALWQTGGGLNLIPGLSVTGVFLEVSKTA